MRAWRVNIVAFVFSVSFVAMEASLTFLSAERFGYTAHLAFDDAPLRAERYAGINSPREGAIHN